MRDFSDLLARAREGDHRARVELHRAYAAPVERWARQALGAGLRNRFDTVDIAQSVFADVLSELQSCEDRGEAAFLGWLRTRVRNKVRSKARRNTAADGSRREARLDTSFGREILGREPDPGRLTALQDDRDRLTRLLGTLDPIQSRIIGLRIDERLSWDEAARRLGLPSAAAARMRYVRALDALRERWNRA